VSQPLSQSIRLFVAEANPISARLLAEAIARDPRIELIGFSSNPDEVFRALAPCSVDVLLLSARMEEDPTRGLALLRQLRSQCAGLKAVVLLDSSKPAVVVDAFRSGGCGVFCRNTEIALLRKCIGAVNEGQIWANSEELAFVLAALSASPTPRYNTCRLTPLSIREKEVVRCMVEGRTNRQIAEKLLISHHTVKNYIFKIFDKIGVSNRVELVFQVLSAPDDFGVAQPASAQQKALSLAVSSGAGSNRENIVDVRRPRMVPPRFTPISVKSVRAVGD
jgi:DNA-binding NarL/FixJ family response regulator